jgi:hypothetical protein
MKKKANKEGRSKVERKIFAQAFLGTSKLYLEYFS